MRPLKPPRLKLPSKEKTAGYQEPMPTIGLPKQAIVA